MIAKLERTQRNAQQNKEKQIAPINQWKSRQLETADQQQQNHRLRITVTGITSAFIIFVLKRKHNDSVSIHISVGGSMISWVRHLSCNRYNARVSTQCPGIDDTSHNLCGKERLGHTQLLNAANGSFLVCSAN